MTSEDSAGYSYIDAAPAHTDAYLVDPVRELLAEIGWAPGTKRVFDLGCGNGATAATLATAGYEMTGVDPSVEGIRIARAHHPKLKLELGSAYDDLARTYGRFPAVISLEVVEHVYFPRTYANCIFDLLEPGGTALISTPFHGYWKNLTLAMTGKMDAHFTALWDHGHIKFWSRRTLELLLETSRKYKLNGLEQRIAQRLAERGEGGADVVLLFLDSISSAMNVAL